MPVWEQGLISKGDACLGARLTLEGCLFGDMPCFLRGMPAWGQGLLVKGACLGTWLNCSGDAFWVQDFLRRTSASGQSLFSERMPP
ncbi:UNVERIFIED_CONTAM: hypothetical protein Sradi_0698600 [Sesamum radiatum]|uniref:Uncharacterized protein n=1 Tax=Sesamum radiatum TaxID=300843 RepID=A0AAW2VQK0_SESRA